MAIAERTHFQCKESVKKNELWMCSGIFIHVFSETVVRKSVCLNSSGKSDIYVMKRLKLLQTPGELHYEDLAKTSYMKDWSYLKELRGK